MRLVFAIISFALAALMIGFGIAQRTILLGDDHATAAVETTSEAPITVIDGAVLNSYDSKQTIEVAGAESNFAGYGRTSDVLAWVGDASYNNLTVDPETGQFVSTLVTGTETEVPDPEGSDLWVDDFREDTSLRFTVDVPADVSVIIVADGIEPAPADVSVTWLLDNSTPWAFPLMIGGAILLLIGLILLLWAVNHVRKARGPRRKQLKMPRVPKPPAYKAIKSPKSGTPVAAPKGRRAIARSVAIVLGILVGALLLGGCTTDPMDAALDSSATAEAADGDTAVVSAGIPAVTAPQAKRIIARIATTIAEADAAGDAKLVATRTDGPALALRASNYAIRKIDTTTKLPPAIPSETVEIVLPQQNDSWPRTVFVVLKDANDDTVAPTALMLIQDDARSQYKVYYALQLEPGAEIPPLPAANIGTSRFTEDQGLLTITPQEVGNDYADVLLKDVDSEFYDLFDEESDLLRLEIGLEAKKARAALIPSTAALTFTTTIGAGQVVALATNDSGAIVALELSDTETIAPVEQGAAVNAPPDVAALLGKALSTKGIRAAYSDQVLFYVPAVATGGKIILLGYAQGLISAKEL